MKAGNLVFQKDMNACARTVYKNESDLLENSSFKLSKQTLIYQIFLGQLANTIFNQSKDIYAAHQGLCQPGEGCIGFHF